MLDADLESSHTVAWAVVITTGVLGFAARIGIAAWALAMGMKGSPW